MGLCGYMQEEMLDEIDWIWHDNSGLDDPYLPVESRAHNYYVYLNTSAPQVCVLSYTPTGVYHLAHPKCYVTLSTLCVIPSLDV